MKTTRIDYRVRVELPDAPEISPALQARLADECNRLIERQMLQAFGVSRPVPECKPQITRSSFGVINWNIGS